MNVKLLEASGKIDGIKMELNAKGNKFYTVTIDKLVYKVFNFFPSFRQLKANEIEIGDNVSVFYAESDYEQNGQQRMSRQLKRFVKDDPKPKQVKEIETLSEVPVEVERVDVHEKKADPVKKAVTESYPEPNNKDTRPLGATPVNKNLHGVTSLQQLYIIRQSSLKSAIEFIGNNTVIGKNIGNNTDEILKTAEKMEKWVLR